MIWSPERVAELIKLRSEGLHEKAIAERFGVSRESIAAKIRRLGLAPGTARQARRAAKPKPEGKRAQLQIGVSLMVGRLPKRWRIGDPEPRDARVQALIDGYPLGGTIKGGRMF